jgi:threonine synthase
MPKISNKQRYVSTRGRAAALDFEGVLLAGLATDGGLYVPETWPTLSDSDICAMAGLPYAELATRVMWPFVAGAIGEDDLRALVSDAYDGFDHRAVAPLIQLDHGEWLMELFHGPTLAFKDYALQIVGRLFDHVLARRGERITIVGATSGDTGSAAIEACRDREAIDIFILHPAGRVSEVQRRQMTTVAAHNVHNVAIEGTFDDCQDLVKSMFNDAPFRDACRLGAVNSINWARIAAQTVYYVAAATALGAPDRPVAFAVPTGNFGNVFAGYVARRMGIPIDQLVIASNPNDILTRFFDTGAMTTQPVVPSISPSMDIQVSSNFERLLFDVMERDGDAVDRAMEGFRADGRLVIDDARLASLGELFDAGRLDDEETRRTIADTYEETGQLLDPHSAIGLAVGRRRRRQPGVPMVALATAHPAKFPDAVEQATGVRPALPDRLADLFEREERFDTLANDLGSVQQHIRARVALSGAA